MSLTKEKSTSMEYINSDHKQVKKEKPIFTLIYMVLLPKIRPSSKISNFKFRRSKYGAGQHSSDHISSDFNWSLTETEHHFY